ncbi:gamma-glutamyltransferase family protein [Bradyrhizobium sp. STM 3566]|uniref:gamma-glutamyltransferase family protein n=1 Tax=Bradyrhizobium sp. STM 3566 TaxID=578928 RepID=UPI0038903F2E
MRDNAPNFEVPRRSTQYARDQMVATSHPLATLAARDVLNAGGNAFDAAVAANAVLAVVEPAMTGIGGDGMVIFSTPDHPQPRAYSALGTGIADPASGVVASRTAFPGCVDIWDTLARDFCSWSLADLLAPAAAFARNGFVVSERTGADWARFASTLSADPNAARHYLKSDGEPFLCGDAFKHPSLAEVLTKIGREGRAAFYEGEVAAELIKAYNALGANVSARHLADYRGAYVDTISSPYRGFDVHICPPPSAGVVALLILRLFERLGFADKTMQQRTRLHLMIQAGKLAYAARDRIRYDASTGQYSANVLFDDNFVDELAVKIATGPVDHEKASPSFSGPHETTYLTVVDKARNVVSFMSTLVDFFGCQKATPDSGILLNSRGEYFTTNAQDPNLYAFGKRPLSFSMPAMVCQQGKPFISGGVVGGVFQPMGLATVLSRIIDQGMSAQQAVSAPRIFGRPDQVEYESGFCSETVAALAKLGHNLVPRSQGPFAHEGPLGAAQVIVLRDGILEGAADHRKDGLVI